MLAKSRFLYFAFLCLALITSSAVASGPLARLNVDDQRIMLLKLSDGTILTDALVLYPDGQRWFVPIGEFSKYLGFEIAVDSTRREANGHVLNKFSIRVETVRCAVIKDSKLSDYPCENAQVFQDDIYVEAHLLESWLQMKLEINTFSSEVNVVPSFRLPIQERAERERQASLLNRGGGAYDPGYPILEVPRKTLDGFIFDQQITAASARNAGVTETSLRQDSFLSGEVLGLESFAFIGSTNEKLDRPRATLQRRSTQTDLLGSAHAREFSLLYLNMPGLPVIGGSTFGVGAAVSSFPLNAPDSYSNQTLQGDLPSGWDVELYQNDTLIQRQISGSDNRYSFSDVPLLYGVNRFKLIFYGPQGQRSETLKTVNVDAQLNRPGVTHYRLSSAYVEETAASPADVRTQARVDSSLFFGFTGRVAYQRMIPRNELSAKDYYLGGFSASLGAFSLNATAVQSSDGGQAIEASTGLSSSFSTLSLTQTFLHNFTSDLFLMESGHRTLRSTRVEFATVPFSTLPLRLTLQPSLLAFDDGTERAEITQRTSLVTGPVLWNNELTKRLQDNTLTGIASANVLMSRYQTRLYAGYSDQRIENAAADVVKNSEAYNLGATLTQFFGLEKYAQALLTFGRRFTSFTLNLNVSAGTNASWGAGGILSYSKALNPETKSLESSASSSTAEGNAAVFVYFDKNRNLKFDAGDEPLPRLRLRNAQIDLPGATDSSGRLFVLHLAPFRPVDLSLVTESLIDPSQKPVEAGVRFLPRAGKTATVEMPVQTFSDFSGTLEFLNRPKRGIEIELTDESHTRTFVARSESDGYFVFERVPPGRYKVAVRNRTINVEGALVKPNVIEVDATEVGESRDDLRFVITAP